MELNRLLNEIDLPKAQWYGIREVSEVTTLRSARDGRPERNVSEHTHGLMVEVLAEGQFGYAATTRNDPDGVREAASRAYAQALNASRWAVHRFTPEQRPKVGGGFLSPYRVAYEERSPAELTGFLVSVCDRLKKSDRIVRTHATLRLVETEMRFVSSNGSNLHQRFLLTSTDFSVTAAAAGVVQTRSDGGLMARSHQAGLEVLDAPDLWERVDRVGEQALELLSAPECPAMTGGLVLLPDQMMLQIHESIGHPLEIDRILGDERNYAGSSFVKAGDFGKLQYGSELLNVTFDPTLPGEFASYGFDDTGTQAGREYLIRDGKLLRGLGGLESQARSGLPGVANARASSWNRPAIDRMANLNLEAGKSSFDEIIESVERGVIMESNRSWSIDDYRRKFQFGCEYGKLIENGKITRTVRNPNYRGVSVPFWRSLAKVGDEKTLGVCGTPFCGKGEPNQVIRVGHASPVCLFENVEIFGGEGGA